MNARIVSPAGALVALAALVASLVAAANAIAAVPAPAPAMGVAQAGPRLAALTVPFVANAGQWDEQAAFGAQTFAGTLFVTTAGQLVYNLPGKPLEPQTGDERAPQRPSRSDAPMRGPGTVLTEALVDADGRPVPLVPSGDRRLATQVSYFVGNDARHRSGLGSFERVALGTPYPGIDVQLRATGNNVEKIFTVAAAHDPRAIRVRLAGAERLEVGADGALVAQTRNGAVTYTAPIAFQEDAAGKRSEVPVRYALLPGRHTYGFVVGDYDHSRPLVIDPLLQATYLHGSFGAIAYALMVLPGSGDVVVAGSTISNDFPCTSIATAGCANGAQSTHNVTSGNDVFVARLSANLQTLVQATYFGGSGEDVASSIVYQPAGDEIVVGGYTQSTDLPCTNGGGTCGVGGQNIYGGGTYDGFIARFSASLTSLLQATYFGGTGHDILRTLAIGAGNTLIAGGSTMSADLPCTNAGGICADGAQKTLLGSTDGFVARFSGSLTSLQQATYFGGTNNDQILTLTIDPANGDVVAAGYAFATDLPCTKPPGCGNGAQTAKAAGLDGFVVRMPASLTSFRQATYLGGSGNDQVTAIAIHPVSGEVIVAGGTGSSDFPCVSSAYGQGCTNGGQMVYGTGASDGFVARLSGNLTNLLQATYVGGSADDALISLAIHPVSGEIFVGGYTGSADLPCTTSLTAGCANGAQQTSGGGDEDAFVARLSADLTFLLQATYLGGLGNDYVFALAIHPASGEILIAGQTGSTDLPCTTIATPGCGNGVQQTGTGGEDGLLARFSPDLTLNANGPGPLAFLPKTNAPPGSVQTSNAVQITGITGSADIYVDGDRTSAYCVAATSACGCANYSALKTTVAAGQFVCVRHVASSIVDQVTRTNLHVGGGRGTYFVTTGTVLGSGCALDVDGNNTIDALTDGLMLMRAMFGLTGTAVTTGALGSSPSRPDWAAIRSYLNGNCGTNFLP